MLSLRRTNGVCWLAVVVGLLTGGVSALPCGHIGPGDEGPQTLATHRCLSLSCGTKTVEGETLTYNGCLLGLTHTSLDEADIQRVFFSEVCNVNGASIQLFAQSSVGTVKGFTCSGLTSHASKQYGVQLSGLANRSQALSGVQVALGLNRVEGASRGVQVGLVNLAGELKGVQVGLLNVNAAGWILPLINFSW